MMCILAEQSRHIDKMLVIDLGGSHSQREDEANQTPVSVLKHLHIVGSRVDCHNYHFALWQDVTGCNALLKVLLTAGHEGKI